MTDDDFSAIERYMGRPVPRAYRGMLVEYPLDLNDWNSPLALFPTRDKVLAWNSELREGEFAGEWGADRFAIGMSACGDTYFLDLKDHSESVFVWDHETHEVSEEAPNLAAFVAECKKLEASLKSPSPPKKPWWRIFGS